MVANTFIVPTDAQQADMPP